MRLSLTPRVGNIAGRRLLAAFGLPGAIFEQSAEALGQVVARDQVAALLSEPERFAQTFTNTLRWLDDAAPGTQRAFVTLGDPAYPSGLLATADPPLLLYLLGQVPVQWPNSIAVVGSRNPTPQGLVNAKEFSRAFAQGGFTVVSGLALGVDGAAHQGALDGASPGQLATIAVVGTGLDKVYPSKHLELARRISERGVIVSEYPLGTEPLAPNFPKRNRIISALSEGTVVVEAALKSGSLITAQQAGEQGREVFAIPGSIHSPQSRGCHALLKQGAKLVESAQDVLEELPSVKGDACGSKSHPALPSVEAELDEEPSTEDAFLQALGHDPVGIDALVARTGQSPAQLQARLLELELVGEVSRLPGGLFQRTGSA